MCKGVRNVFLYTLYVPIHYTCLRSRGDTLGRADCIGVIILNMMYECCLCIFFLVRMCSVYMVHVVIVDVIHYARQVVRV